MVLVVFAKVESGAVGFQWGLHFFSLMMLGLGLPVALLLWQAARGLRAPPGAGYPLGSWTRALPRQRPVDPPLSGRSALPLGHWLSEWTSHFQAITAAGTRCCGTARLTWPPGHAFVARSRVPFRKVGCAGMAEAVILYTYTYAPVGPSVNEGVRPVAVGFARPAAVLPGEATMSAVAPVRLCAISEVTPRPVDWLWPHRLGLGKLSLLEGDPGLGKSFLALDLCARLSTGRPWPDGTASPSASACIYLTGEDGAHDTIAPRLRALGAHPGRRLRPGPRDRRHGPGTDPPRPR